MNTHGVRGEVKIQPWADSPEFLKDFGTLYIDGAPVKVRSARVHKGCVIASLEDIDDVNGAMRLKGKLVSIDRRDAKLPEGGYFIQDIIGARVVDENGAEVGMLAEVLNLPGSDVYVVRGAKGRVLFPALARVIKEEDPSAGVIALDREAFSEVAVYED